MLTPSRTQVRQFNCIVSDVQGDFEHQKNSLLAHACIRMRQFFVLMYNVVVAAVVANVFGCRWCCFVVVVVFIWGAEGCVNFKCTQYVLYCICIFLQAPVIN